MQQNKSVHLPVVSSGATLRNDAWWVGPALTVLVLGGFIVYATFRAFENAGYEWGPYLSPFYSPFFDTSFAKGWPIKLTPAMLILAGPASFRFTCYYYRKAYYRAFGWDPPACAVGERSPHQYSGETSLFVFQNLHRFTMYVAIVFLVVLWKDAIVAVTSWKDGVHVGVGSLVMLANVIFLSGYTFGCHALRHLVGGSVNSYSRESMGMLRHKLWRAVTVLNERHAPLAWVSLFGVALTDFYVRMVSLGVVADVRLF